MNDIGFICKTGAKGGITVSRDPLYTGEIVKPMVYSCYQNIWKRDYPLLKLNKRAEDICELCFRFANRHKYLAKHRRHSANDVNTDAPDDTELFREDAAVHEMDNKPEEEEETYDVAIAPAEPDVAETPVGVDVYTNLATAEDDREIPKDSNAITAEDQRELQRRKADNKREEMLI